MLKTLKIVLNVLGGHLYNVQVSDVSIDLVHRRTYIHLYVHHVHVGPQNCFPEQLISLVNIKKILTIFFSE